MSTTVKSTSAISFSDDYSDFLLIDVSDEEIKKCFTVKEEEGTTTTTTLHIKGGNKQTEACLCTGSSTYALFSRETSNELLLLSGNIIEGCGAHRILEPVRVAPRLDQLKQLLEAELFTSDELYKFDQHADDNDDENDDEQQDIQHSNDYNDEQKRKRMKAATKSLTTFDQLLRTVQASESEIINGLKSFGAFETAPGKGWRVMDKPLEERVLKAFINAMIAEDVDVKKDPLDPTQVTNLVSEFPDYIVKAIYDKFVLADGMLNLQMVVSNQIEAVLSKLGRNAEISWDDLSNQLIDFQPLGIDESIISQAVKGVGLVSEDGKRIAYFPVYTLSKDARKRCEELFARRSFWSADELRTSLEGVDGGSDPAIQKYARAFTNPKGERGYIKR